MFWTSLKVFLTFTLLTGCIYPFVVTEIAQFTMPKQANGSLVIVDGKIRGSELIGQPFKDDRYFWPRPSAVDYDPLHSGGSNLGPTSAKLKEMVAERAKKISALPHAAVADIPTDLLYASGSGLDPHISVEAAIYQFNRIAKARGIPREQWPAFRQTAEKLIEGRQGGFLGPRYVNVLKLNQLLDKQFPPPKPA